jgi:hypothetical protein
MARDPRRLHLQKALMVALVGGEIEAVEAAEVPGAGSVKAPGVGRRTAARLMELAGIGR